MIITPIVVIGAVATGIASAFGSFAFNWVVHRFHNHESRLAALEAKTC